MSSSPGRMKRFVNGDGLPALLMVLPALCLFAVFFIWPFARGFWLSLNKWDGFSQPVFVGLANYARLTSDPLFLKALGNNLIFVAAILVLKNALGLGLAMLLDRAVIGRAFFRGAYDDALATVSLPARGNADRSALCVAAVGWKLSRAMTSWAPACELLSHTLAEGIALQQEGAAAPVAVQFGTT